MSPRQGYRFDAPPRWISIVGVAVVSLVDQPTAAEGTDGPGTNQSTSAPAALSFINDKQDRRSAEALAKRRLTAAAYSKAPPDTPRSQAPPGNAISGYPPGRLRLASRLHRARVQVSHRCAIRMPVIAEQIGEA
jgi:hypothetical protein